MSFKLLKTIFVPLLNAWLIRSGLSKMDSLVYVLQIFTLLSFWFERYLDTHDMLLLDDLRVRCYTLIPASQMWDFMWLSCSHIHGDAFGCDRMCYDAIWLFWIQIYTLIQYYRCFTAMLLSLSYLLIMIWDEFYPMAIYFILVSLHFLWMWVM